ncbi:MAG: nuclear transport factor 2 family protein [Bacteroidota bacterium]
MKLPLVLILIGAMLFAGCTNPSENLLANKSINLQPGYQNVKTLITKAKCTGPNGDYSTTVHSTLDGYTIFHQERVEREDFQVVLINHETGFQVGDDEVIGAPIQKVVADIAKGHEYHKISMFPRTYFSDLNFSKTTDFEGIECKLFSGIDPSGNPGSLFIDTNTQTVKGFEIRNPFDTIQVIKTVYKTWQTSDYGQLVKTLEIIQGGRDTFTFDFEETSINSPDFERKLSSDEGELLKAVHQFNVAFKDSDLAMLDSLTTPNYIHTNGNSRAIRKADWFNYLEKRQSQLSDSTLVVKNYSMDEVRTEIYKDAAIVTAKISVDSDKEGNNSENKYRVTNFWVRENGQWKRAGFHDGKIK